MQKFWASCQIKKQDRMEKPCLKSYQSKLILLRKSTFFVVVGEADCRPFCSKAFLAGTKSPAVPSNCRLAT